MNSRIVTAVGVSVLSAGIMANSGGGAPAGTAVQAPNASGACSRLVGARLGSPHTEITAAEQITSPFAAPDNARSRWRVGRHAVLPGVGRRAADGGLRDPIRSVAATGRGVERTLSWRRRGWVDGRHQLRADVDEQ